MTKNILFIGDSITEGVTGINYINLIKKNYSHYNFINMGQGGDTLFGVRTRILAALREENDFSVIVIEVGHNDLLIPYLEKRSSSWRTMASYLREQGSIPTPNIKEYRNLLEKTLKEIKEVYSGNIVLTTLSCLGENLSSKINIKRKELNEEIKSVGREYGCFLADVGKAFDGELEGKKTRNDLEETFLNPDFINASGFVNETEKALFHLTVDGCHLNEKGAELYSQVITEAKEPSLCFCKKRGLLRPLTLKLK